MLCNVARYSSPNYIERVPPLTGQGEGPIIDATRHCGPDCVAHLREIKERLEQDAAGKDARRSDKATEDLMVLNFLLEGMDEEQESGPAVYGSRAPHTRLTDVLSTLHDELKVHVYPSLEGETREQFWRRVARYYIQHFKICHHVVYGCDTAEENADDENCAYGDPFYIVDFGMVMEQMARWRAALPMVRPFYAVKCNPYLPLIRLLAAMGAGFDCASKAEIELVKSHVGDACDDVIFANPCKRVGDLKAAARLGVCYMTFDNEEELGKIALHSPAAKAVLRLATDDSAAVCAFSTKFGAKKNVVPRLLERAAELKVDVAGISFHVGSGNSDPKAYLAALADAKEAFKLAAELGHSNCHLLDIGGGYPGSLPGRYEQSAIEGEKRNASFEEIAEAMRPVLEEDFSTKNIISEPGRFFTESSHALLMHVYARRIVEQSGSGAEQEYQYYVNDGLYHSFNCILYDHAHPHLILLNDHEHISGAAEPFSKEAQRPTHVSSIFGPTCDSLDCIVKQQPFPEMKVGDWILSPDMGSYTTAGGCPFNGIATRRRVFISSLACL